MKMIHLIVYSSFFLPGIAIPNPARMEAAAAPKIVNSFPVPVFGNSFLRSSTVVSVSTVDSE